LWWINGAAPSKVVGVVGGRGSGRGIGNKEGEGGERVIF